MSSSVRALTSEISVFSSFSDRAELKSAGVSIATGGRFEDPTLSHDAVAADDHRVRKLVGELAGTVEIVAAQGSGQGSGHPSEMLGFDSGLEQQIFGALWRRQVTDGGCLGGSNQPYPTVEIGQRLDLLG